LLPARCPDRLIVDEGLDALDAGILERNGLERLLLGNPALVLARPLIIALPLVTDTAGAHQLGEDVDRDGSPFADIAFQHDVLDAVGRVGRDLEFAAAVMVDIGVSEDVAGGVLKVPYREGAYSRIGVGNSGLPEVGQPGVAARCMAVDCVCGLRVDDLLPGGDIGIGIGPEHAGAKLPGRAADRVHDARIGLEGAEHADDPAGCVIDFVDGDLAVVDRVPNRFLCQVDMGLGLPRPGRLRQSSGDDGQGGAGEHGTTKASEHGTILK
jgi:hypothetical protein